MFGITEKNFFNNVMCIYMYYDLSIFNLSRKFQRILHNKRIIKGASHRFATFALDNPFIIPLWVIKQKLNQFLLPPQIIQYLVFVESIKIQYIVLFILLYHLSVIYALSPYFLICLLNPCFFVLL